MNEEYSWSNIDRHWQKLERLDALMLAGNDNLVIADTIALVVNIIMRMTRHATETGEPIPRPTEQMVERQLNILQSINQTLWKRYYPMEQTGYSPARVASMACLLLEKQEPADLHPLTRQLMQMNDQAAWSTVHAGSNMIQRIARSNGHTDISLMQLARGIGRIHAHATWSDEERWINNLSAVDTGQGIYQYWNSLGQRAVRARVAMLDERYRTTVELLPSNPHRWALVSQSQSSPARLREMWQETLAIQLAGETQQISAGEIRRIIHEESS